VNHKADVIDELEVSETFSEALPEAETHRIATGVDIVDSINRAAFKRRMNFDPCGTHYSNKAAGSHH